MDDAIGVVALQVQDFEQVACSVGSDAEALGRLMLEVDVEEAHSVVPSVQDLLVGQAMTMGRLMDPHSLNVTRLRSVRTAGTPYDAVSDTDHDDALVQYTATARACGRSRGRWAQRWEAYATPVTPEDLPSTRDLEAPVLAALRHLGGSAQVRTVYATVIELQRLTHEMAQVRYPVSGAFVLNDRISWALSQLRTRGLVQSPRRGWWQLTEQ